jgi:hypothetical protein
MLKKKYFVDFINKSDGEKKNNIMILSCLSNLKINEKKRYLNLLSIYFILQVYSKKN